MNLKKLRQDNNLTQEDVGKIIGKTASAYGYYETCRNEPDLKTILKLADYYNVSLDYLCGRQYNNNVGYIPDEKKNTVQKLVSLNETEFIRADAYIDALIDGQNKK